MLASIFTNFNFWSHNATFFYITKINNFVFLSNIVISVEILYELVLNTIEEI